MLLDHILIRYHLLMQKRASLLTAYYTNGRIPHLPLYDGNTADKTTTLFDKLLAFRDCYFYHGSLSFLCSVCTDT